MERIRILIKEAVFHRPGNNFAYAYDSETIHIRLRTKKEDMRRVTLIHGDPYIWKKGEWQAEEKPMEKTGSDELFDYWFTSLQPPYRRLRYSFKLENEKETAVFPEKDSLLKYPSMKSTYHFSFLF